MMGQEDENQQRKGKMRLPTGGVPTIPDNLFPIPENRYADVMDEIENDLHMSRQDKTNREKVGHTLSFLSGGLSLLPEEEIEYVKRIREELEKQKTFPLPDTRPSVDTHKQAIYEISIDIGTGFTTRCLAQDMPAILLGLIELKYEEIFQALLPYRDDLVRKMIEYELLEQREEYKGGAIRDELGLSQSLDEILEGEEE